MKTVLYSLKQGTWSLFTFCLLATPLLGDDFGIDNSTQVELAESSEAPQVQQSYDELSLNDPESSPEMFRRALFPGFNELYLADPLTLPPNFLVGYDPKDPLSHLDEQWRTKFTSLVQASKFLMKRGQWSDAIHTLRQALLIAPDEPQTRNLLGNCYYRLGYLTKAETEYSRVLELFPDFTPARKSRSRILLLLAYEILEENKNTILPEAKLINKQNYLLQCIKDSEFLIDFLLVSMRQNPITQRQSEKQIHLMNFQIYLCQLGLSDEQEVSRTLSRYSAKDNHPTWYFMRAASSLSQVNDLFQDSEQKTEAEEKIESAKRVYITQDINLYLSLLQEIGWL